MSIKEMFCESIFGVFIKREVIPDYDEIWAEIIKDEAAGKQNAENVVNQNN